MAKADIFTPIRPNMQLHPQFEHVRQSPLFTPARGMLREVFATFEDPDGNFLEQFQTTGFDTRTFEIFLFAMFREARFTINRSHKRPDFMLEKDGHVICVEAVTANPPLLTDIKPYKHIPAERTDDQAAAYFRDEVPIRFGSPLFTKLGMKYWELSHVAGHPLVLAIQSFHADGSLAISASPLTEYLYGLSYNWYHDADGKLIISTKPIDEHQLGAKRIPSGFFAQPTAENISAVLFSNSGTIVKFNRMGHEGAHRSNAVRMLRSGTCYRHDPNATLPAPFVYEVGDGDGRETWREGTVLIHNPNARYPLPPEFLGASAEANLEDGKAVTNFAEPFHPFASTTMNFRGDTPPAALQMILNKIAEDLASVFPPPTH